MESNNKSTEVLIPVILKKPDFDDAGKRIDMIGKNIGLIYRNRLGNLEYLSFLNNKRYGAGNLEFEGSEERFIDLIKCFPPDLKSNNEYYRDLEHTAFKRLFKRKQEKMWLPVFEDMWLPTYLKQDTLFQMLGYIKKENEVRK